MKRLLISFLICALGPGCALPAPAQESVAGIDLLYPQLAHPHEDAFAAMKKRDFRFIIVDRSANDVPGLEKHQNLRWIYGTKLVKTSAICLREQFADFQLQYSRPRLRGAIQSNPS